MTFARRFPAHLLPQVEDALAHLLHNVGEGEWEVVILRHDLPHHEPRRPFLMAEESDEQPVITQETHDE